MNRFWIKVRHFSTSRINFSSTNANETFLECSQSNGVRRITLNHPKTLNSLSLKMMEKLLFNLENQQDDIALRSIVIDAAPGKVFCAGHNLKEMTTGNSKETWLEIFKNAEKLMAAMRACPVPIIGAVDGLAAAAGCQLATSCDILICTERSSFSTPAANFGMFCSTPGIPLARNVSKKVASYMLFTGFPLPANEAFNAGLVSKVVPNDKLEEEVSKITNAISTKSRSVIQLGKEFFYKQIEMNISSAYSHGTETMIKNLELQDGQHGIDSFLRKKTPVWKHTFDKNNDN